MDVDVNAFEIDLKEICPVIHFAEIELCGNTSSSTNSVPPQLCSLLSLLNHTFCQDEKAEKGEKHIHENTKFNIMNLSKTTEKYIEKLDEKLYKELDEKVQQYIKKVNITYFNSNSSSSSSSSSSFNNKNNVKFNPKDLCPVFDLIDKTFCASSSNNNKINPKDLCPLLEFVEKELCS